MIRSLTRNLGLKIFSVFAAFLLWLAYSGARELTTSLSVPVQYRNIPKNLEISSNIVEQVHLILRGPSPLLSRLTSSQYPVVLDLAAVRSPGLITFTIDRRNVGLPSGIVLERAIPAQIQIRTETRVSREVPVLPRFEHIPEGMRVASCDVLPPRLTLIGPKSRVDAIERVETDPVDLRALPEDGRIRTTAFTGDQQVNFIAAPSLILRITLVPATSQPKNP